MNVFNINDMAYNYETYPLLIIAPKNYITIDVPITGLAEGPLNAAFLEFNRTTTEKNSLDMFDLKVDPSYIEFETTLLYKRLK